MAERKVATKDCDRCGGRKKPATQTRRWGVDKDQLEIDLCDEHGIAFDRDMGMWARLSRDITPAVHKSQFEMTRERQIDRATAERFRPVPPQDPRVVVVTKLPAKFHTWTLSEHAKQRCEERGISERDALIAASDPSLAFPDPKNPEYWIHQRGDIDCIVVRQRNIVVTVMDEATFLARQAEREEASAGNN